MYISFEFGFKIDIILIYLKIFLKKNQKFHIFSSNIE